MRVRCKFQVTGVELFMYPEGSGSVKMSAVYQSGGKDGNACEENHIFGKATPSASLSMNIHNPDALQVFVDAFKRKKPFYLDFTEAPE